ncbi:MAG: hypothetical protein ACI9H6_000153 [Patiriisocius sp.]|jgi:hypothetical protein
MENETLEHEKMQVEQTSPLHQVTPLSKYLALALFVILPFLGGWIGYTYAPEKVVVKEVIVGKETEAKSAEIEKVLFVDFDVTSSSDSEYAMNWSSHEDVQKIFGELDTAYITFALVPEGEGVSYRNKNGVLQSIGDGFTFDQKSYSFSPKSYAENFSWELDWGSEYQVFAQVTYQPRSFECDPLVKGECSPVYSKNDKLLITEAGDYVFMSKPFVLE